MAEQLQDIGSASKQDLRKLSREEFMALGGELLTLYEQDRQDNQLRYYHPVSPAAQKIHESPERTIGVGGGNGSSKTETCMVELMICSTGIVPDSLSHIDYRARFKGPRKQRIVVESLTTTLETIILPKMQWWVWTGLGMPGSDKGHWGWIPRWSLIDGSWEKSWSAKLRLLKFLCRDIDNPDKVLGTSSIQFMSHTQDPQDFASGDFDEILHDEPPRQRIWMENEARTMRAKGRNLLAMTWPDDPAIPVEWIHDIYEKGQGIGKKPNVVWHNLFTTDNPHLDQETVAEQAEDWDEMTRQVRIYGQSIRFSNRVHPLFTQQECWWCFRCKKQTFPHIPEDGANPQCGTCEHAEIVTYSHVKDFETQPNWPTVFLLDPHPRKPHMMNWYQISPSDDWYIRAELLCDKSCEELAEDVFNLEERLGLRIAKRLIDPNMGRSPSSAQQREQTWQDSFWDVGISCDLADDSGVGRKVVNTMLKPDYDILGPRMTVHPSCEATIHQFLRFSWDDWKRDAEKDQKQAPRPKYDDFPALARYAANADLSFSSLSLGDPIITNRPANREARRGIHARS